MASRASKKMNKSPCSSRCWPSGHAAGKRRLLHGICFLSRTRRGYTIGRCCPGGTCGEIFKLSLLQGCSAGRCHWLWISVPVGRWRRAAAEAVPPLQHECRARARGSMRPGRNLPAGVRLGVSLSDLNLVTVTVGARGTGCHWHRVGLGLAGTVTVTAHPESAAQGLTLTP